MKTTRGMAGLGLAVAALAATSLAPVQARAQGREMMGGMMMTRPPSITVNASGNVEYVPDIARMQLGVRNEAPTATAAAEGVNTTAAQVIAAIERLGIPARSIQTSGYNLEYREPPAPQPGQPQPMAAQARMAPAGSYVASETLQVTTAVADAGRVLDAAIAAGANVSYGLSYQSSRADSLYLEALGKAVAAARRVAQTIAGAAGLHVVRIETISTVAPSAEVSPGPMMARMVSAAPILPGTDTISATVFVTFLVR